ncbi:Glycosyltransferase [hydrothermal vent metagenome]|uniref:Glycosyltransferase n=1 Tax=hydrothermal vent metagenome TaxID=652676 RepID=A0A1W1EHW8_9ZZZZ
MKIAIVHDWLTTNAGAEKVLREFLDIYPNADIFSLVDFLDDKDREDVLNGRKVTTSFIQNLPFAKNKFRNYLGLFPLAIEQFDLSEYDLILSSSHAVAKGVLTHSEQVHISYVHTPIRYAWDLYFRYLEDNNLQKGFKATILKYILHKIRIWDYTTANRVDYYISNSNYIAKRIAKIYNKSATTIYPPVDIDKFKLCINKEDFYLTASRLVPYKKIDLIVEAFAKSNKKLVVIGDGTQMEYIKSKATSNIEILGYQEDSVLLDYMQRAKAFIFAGVEDFGITPVEAMACGTPVIALNQGGLRESIESGINGIFFEEQSVESIKEAINRFESISFKPSIIRDSIVKFGRDRFKKEIEEFIRIVF